MGSSYLKICSCFSLGSIGYTVYERFLQATGKTMLSTVSQISGAVANIILDYIFIYPFNMGIEGAAWATIIGQFISLFIAMYFHYKKNTEIDGNVKYIKPNIKIIKEIYNIGISAALMQALLAVMMAGMNAILGLAQTNQTVLIGSFGIYYKIQQIALFSAFGLSNTIISIFGMQDKKRIDDCIKYGIVDTILITLIISFLFEIFASPLANLFGLAGSSTKETIKVCILALRISSIGFIFMGISVAIQGVLQSIRYAFRPFIISLLRLVIFEEIYDNFLSLDVNKEAIINQSKVIRKNANETDAVIVERCANYILKDNKNLVKVFLYASMDYKIKNIMKNYNDDKTSAEKHIINSDKSRSNYYSAIANKVWGGKDNYDLCIDAKIGNENVVEIICNYVKNKKLPYFVVLFCNKYYSLFIFFRKVCKFPIVVHNAIRIMSMLFLILSFMIVLVFPKL